ncbi:FUSC family protein [Cupriavidus sp. YAF13]|uniref:FUSC family protein n=1 Tax=Cupriavidus sp. YAF13 TaxID=3233075 RepID=UPI003F91F0F4
MPELANGAWFFIVRAACMNIDRISVIDNTARTTALVRGVGRKWRVKRIRRASWRDLADLAAHAQESSAHDAHAGRMLDRIAQFAPRVAPGDGQGGARVACATRTAYRADIVALQHQPRHTPALCRNSVHSLARCGYSMRFAAPRAFRAPLRRCT